MTTSVDYLYQLLAAFEADEVLLRFDPVYRTEGLQLKLHGLRCVVDWSLKSRNNVTSIFNEAERFGMSMAVDEPLIRLVFKYLNIYKSAFDTSIQLYVPAAIASFTTDNLVRLISELADDAEFDLAKLTFCLKDNYPSKDYHEQLFHLNELKSLNVNLSIAHSENYFPRVDLMTRTQFKSIELSRELALKYKSNRHMLTYLKGMIATVRGLEKSVYVDGVSDIATINFFRDGGAEYFSGDALSELVSANDLININRLLDVPIQSASPV